MRLLEGGFGLAAADLPSDEREGLGELSSTDSREVSAEGQEDAGTHILLIVSSLGGFETND